MRQVTSQDPHILRTVMQTHDLTLAQAQHHAFSFPRMAHVARLISSKFLQEQGMNRARLLHSCNLAYLCSAYRDCVLHIVHAPNNFEHH